jgi:hypothetical protein
VVEHLLWQETGEIHAARWRSLVLNRPARACILGNKQQGATHLRTFTRVVYLGVMASLLIAAGGCTREKEVYRYEHGDRVDSRGHRDVGWCDHHHEDEHCR